MAGPRLEVESLFLANPIRNGSIVEHSRKCQIKRWYLLRRVGSHVVAIMERCRSILALRWQKWERLFMYTSDMAETWTKDSAYSSAFTIAVLYLTIDRSF